MKALKASVVALFCLAGNPVMAQGVPTVDTSNILQTIKQLDVLLQDLGIQSDLLDSAMKQVEKLQAQLDQLQQIYARFTGAREIVDFAMGNGLDAILDGSLTGVIASISSAAKGDFSGFVGGKSGAMTATAEKALSNSGLSKSDVTAMANSGVPAAERTATQAAGGAVLAAVAEQTYTEAGIGLQRVEKLVEASKNSEDIKESIDLNTRMLAEIAVLMAKQLEIASISGAYAGQSGVSEAAAIAEERAYMTFANE